MARDVWDCTLIRDGLILVGRGRSCGTADVYVHCMKAWSDLPKRGLNDDWGSKVWEFDKK